MGVAESATTGSSSKESKGQADYTPESFKVLLKKLVQSPTEFTPDDCAFAFRHLCVQGASDAQVRIVLPDTS